MRIAESGTGMAAVLVLVVGCGSGTKAETGADSGALDSGEGEGEGEGEAETDCGSTPPEIVEITWANIGLQDVDGSSVPVIVATVIVRDADADLTTLSAEVFLDGTVDGSVDTGASPFLPSEVTVDGSPCTVPQVGLELGLPMVPELGLDYGSDAEFGFIASDASGLASPLVISAFCVPNEDGSDCAG